MTDFTITSGTASYQRVRQPAPYESQTPALTLNFEVAPGADPEVVTAKVMLMAKNTVEGVFLTTTSQPATVSAEQPLRKRKAAPSEPVTGSVPAGGAPSTVDVPAPAPDGDASSDPLSALAEKDDDEPTAAPSPEDDLAALEGGVVIEAKQPTTEDVTKTLMKASAHLRKEFGHINDITKLLTAFGVGGWGSLKPEQYADFIDKANALCDLKKS